MTDDKYDTFTLTNDDARDVRFKGVELASASSHNYQGPRSSRWTEFDLYRTAGGKFVCHRVNKTCWAGETDSYTVRVVDNHAEVVDWFGVSDLAKELYKEAGIEFVEDVE